MARPTQFPIMEALGELPGRARHHGNRQVEADLVCFKRGHMEGCEFLEGHGVHLTKLLRSLNVRRYYT